jgi:hypothetical protein
MQDPSDPSFYLLATTYKLEPELQVELLLAFAQDVQPAFKHWLAALDADLAAAQQEAKEPEMPVIHTSDLGAFFDRDLTRRNLESLVELKPSDADDETGSNIYWPDGEYFTLLEGVLKAGMRIAEEPFNQILGGYYVDVEGGTILIMVVNGDATGAPFVDAVMILPKDTPYRDVPNISLEPRKQLAGIYQFEYPDGTFRTLNLAAHE